MAKFDRHQFFQLVDFYGQNIDFPIHILYSSSPIQSKKIKGTWNLNFAIENILSYLKMVIFQASNNDSVKSWNTFFHGEKSAFRQHCDRLMSLFGLNTLKVRMEIERYRNITHFVFTQKFQKEAKRYYFVDEKIGKWYSFKLNIYFVSKAPKFRNFFLFKIFFYFSWGHFSNIQYQRFESCFFTVSMVHFSNVKWYSSSFRIFPGFTKNI